MAFAPEGGKHRNLGHKETKKLRLQKDCVPEHNQKALMVREWHLHKSSKTLCQSANGPMRKGRKMHIHTCMHAQLLVARPDLFKASRLWFLCTNACSHSDMEI